MSQGPANRMRKIPFPAIPQGLDRPFVVVNCASSVDGKLALPDGRQTRISSDDDIAYVHELRHWAQAVVVGIDTIIMDDPKLTVKEKYVRDPVQPLRIVVDSCCRVPPGSEVMDGSASTLIATTDDPMEIMDRPGNIELFRCGSRDKVDLKLLMNHLWKRDVRRVMVEGGGTLIASFLADGLVDEFQIFIGDMVIGGRESPTPSMGRGAQEFEDIVKLDRYAMYPMDGGIRVHYRVHRE